MRQVPRKLPSDAKKVRDGGKSYLKLTGDAAQAGNYILRHGPGLLEAKSALLITRMTFHITVSRLNLPVFSCY